MTKAAGGFGVWCDDTRWVRRSGGGFGARGWKPWSAATLLPVTNYSLRNKVLPVTNYTLLQSAQISDGRHCFVEKIPLLDFICLIMLLQIIQPSLTHEFFIYISNLQGVQCAVILPNYPQFICTKVVWVDSFNSHHMRSKS